MGSMAERTTAQETAREIARSALRNFPHGTVTHDRIEEFVLAVAPALTQSRLSGAEEMTRFTTPRPLDDWHEDFGDALWWFFPVQEAPYAGSPLDTNWPGYHTHWTPIPMPALPLQSGSGEDANG